MRTVSFAAATLVLAGALGCASSSKQQRAEAPATQQAQAPSTPAITGICPMQVPGASVAPSDTSTGAALAFTTSSSDPNDLAQLRARVEHLAAIFNNKGGACPCHHGQGMQPGPGEQGQQGMQNPSMQGGGCGSQGGAGSSTGSMGSTEESGPFGQFDSGGAMGESEDSQMPPDQSGGVGGSGKAKKGAKPAPPPPQPAPSQPEAATPPPPPPGPPGALPPATATYEPIDSGARLVFTPSNPSDLEALRAAVRARAQMMSQAGGCPMMKGPGGEQPGMQPGAQQQPGPQGSGGSGEDSSIPLEQQSFPIPVK